MELLIANHNPQKKIWSKIVEMCSYKNCNGPVESSCSHDGKCLAKNLIYKATPRNGTSTKYYIGAAEGEENVRSTSELK